MATDTYICTTMKNLILLLFFIPLFALGQHSINGTFAPIENYKWAILYRVDQTGTFYTADTRMDDKGAFKMSLDENVSPGVYRMVFGLPAEEYSFDLLYSGKEDIELKYEEGKGVSYVSSEENKLWNDYLDTMEKMTTQIVNGYVDGDKKTTSNTFKLRTKAQKEFEKISEGTIAASFIKASKGYVPNDYEDGPTFLKNQKATYFDAIDATDTILQKSQFIFQKAYSYIKEKEDVSAVAQFLDKANQEYQKSMLLQIWEQLVAEDRVETANFLHKMHLSPLAKRLKDTKLVNKLFKFEMLSIGHLSPNFSWTDEDEKKHWFHEIEGAENYILVFWSSTCSHCLNELPKLQKKIKTLPEGKFQVVAFGLEDDIYGWKNETLRLPAFMHIPGLGKWDNMTCKSYDVNKTPTYFVMDKDKVITAKPDELEDLFEVIDPQEKAAEK